MPKRDGDHVGNALRVAFWLAFGAQVFAAGGIVASTGDWFWMWAWFSCVCLAMGMSVARWAWRERRSER